MRIVLVSTRIHMYICNCMGITDREIRGAAELGCETVADLSRDLGLGTCCGKCVPDANRVLRACGSRCAPALHVVGGDD